jgi:hypothetical protein
VLPSWEVVHQLDGAGGAGGEVKGRSDVDVAWEGNRKSDTDMDVEYVMKERSRVYQRKERRRRHVRWWKRREEKRGEAALTLTILADWL